MTFIEYATAYVLTVSASWLLVRALMRSNARRESQIRRRLGLEP